MNSLFIANKDKEVIRGFCYYLADHNTSANTERLQMFTTRTRTTNYFRAEEMDPDTINEDELLYDRITQEDRIMFKYIKFGRNQFMMLSIEEKVSELMT
jgi:hypothetical protein